MKNITRRSFIRQSTTVAAGAGVAAALPSSPRARPIGANDDIRVAVVGLGGQGRNHVKRFNEMKGVRVVALCDPDRKRMQEAAELLEGQKFDTYVDYRKLLENKDIDAVSTASCNHWHAPVTVWGCEAGKDVFVEKPVSHTVWEGQQMIKAARKHNRIVQSGMQLRSDRGVREAFQWLHDGNLGKILLSRGLCYEDRSSMGRVDKPTPIPDYIDYDLWCGPSPHVPLMRKELHFHWHFIWNTGNGDLGNQGIHQMDMCRRAVRQDKLPPRVISVGGRFAWNDDGQTPNTQFVFYDYKPVPILFEVTQMPEKKGVDRRSHYKGIRCGNVVHCEDGYFACGESGGGWAYDNDGKKVKQFIGDGAGEHLQNFIDAVRSRKLEDLNADVRDGHISAALCHMGNISHLLGKTSPPENIGNVLKNFQDMTDAFERFQAHLEANEIDISKEEATLGPLLTMDPDREEFTGPLADDANKLLTKRYREPFVIAGAETTG
jgi:hypothetical protein